MLATLESPAAQRLATLSDLLSLPGGLLGLVGAIGSVVYLVDRLPSGRARRAREKQEHEDARLAEQRRENITGLRQELGELQFRLALQAFIIELRYGVVSRPFLERIDRAIGSYTGPNANPEMTALFRKLLAEPAARLDAYTARKRAEAKGIFVPPFDTGRFDMIAANPALFDEDVRRRLADIRADLGVVNETIRNAQRYEELTFTVKDPADYEKVLTNYRNSLRQVGQRALTIADKIAPLLEAR